MRSRCRAAGSDERSKTEPRDVRSRRSPLRRWLSAVALVGAVAIVPAGVVAASGAADAHPLAVIGTALLWAAIPASIGGTAIALQEASGRRRMSAPVLAVVIGFAVFAAPGAVVSLVAPGSHVLVGLAVLAPVVLVGVFTTTLVAVVLAGMRVSIRSARSTSE